MGCTVQNRITRKRSSLVHRGSGGDEEWMRWGDGEMGRLVADASQRHDLEALQGVFNI
jgi:hypothetical protein